MTNMIKMSARTLTTAGALVMVLGMNACGSSAKVIDNGFDTDVASVDVAKDDGFDAIAFDRELREEMFKLDRTPYDMSQLTFLADEDAHGASESASAGYSKDADAKSEDTAEVDGVASADASTATDTQTTASNSIEGNPGEVRSVEQLIEDGRNGNNYSVTKQFEGTFTDPVDIDKAVSEYLSENPNKAAELHELAETDDLTYEERLAAMRAIGI